MVEDVNMDEIDQLVNNERVLDKEKMEIKKNFNVMISVFIISIVSVMMALQVIDMIIGVTVLIIVLTSKSYYESNKRMNLSTAGYLIDEIVNYGDMYWREENLVSTYEPTELEGSEFSKFDTYKFYEPGGKFLGYYVIPHAFGSEIMTRMKMDSSLGLVDILGTTFTTKIIGSIFEYDKFVPIKMVLMSPYIAQSHTIESKVDGFEMARIETTLLEVKDSSKSSVTPHKRFEITGIRCHNCNGRLDIESCIHDDAIGYYIVCNYCSESNSVYSITNNEESK